ncbi:hypothetical protein H0X06_01745 [Candidatus Dependentiae bacterium]|nr:hypothetical protein [Candidatus Dependentiae bacterium]
MKKFNNILPVMILLSGVLCSSSIVQGMNEQPVIIESEKEPVQKRKEQTIFFKNTTNDVIVIEYKVSETSTPITIELGSKKDLEQEFPARLHLMRIYFQGYQGYYDVTDTYSKYVDFSLINGTQDLNGMLVIRIGSKTGNYLGLQQLYLDTNEIVPFPQEQEVKEPIKSAKSSEFTYTQKEQREKPTIKSTAGLSSHEHKPQTFRVPHNEKGLALNSEKKIILTKQPTYKKSPFMIRDIQSGEIVVTLKENLISWETNKPVVTTVVKKMSSLNSAEFSSNGEYLITVDGQNEVCLWDVKSGKLIKMLSAPQMEYGQRSFAHFSPDGSMIALAHGTRGQNTLITLWPLQEGSINSVKLLPTQSIRVQGRVSALAFSPQEKMLLYGTNDGTVTLMDIQSGKEIFSVSSGKESIEFVVFSPDEKIIASSDGSQVILWDIQTKKIVHTLKDFTPGNSKPITALMFSPIISCNCLAIYDRNAQEISVWNTQSGKKQFTLTDAGRGTVLLFSKDGTQLYVLSNIEDLWTVRLTQTEKEDSVKRWDIPSQK